MTEHADPPAGLFGRLLNVDQAAEVLGMHPAVVRRKARTGAIEHYRLGSGKTAYLFTVEQLEAYLVPVARRDGPDRPLDAA